MNELPIDMIVDAITKVRSGTMKRVDIETKEFVIKVYQVNSSSRYAYNSIRVDIQDLEIGDYS